MKQQSYLIISAVIFGLVGIMHLVRAINGSVFHIGSFSVPVIVSWIASVVALLLCIWGFTLVARR